MSIINSLRMIATIDKNTLFIKTNQNKEEYAQKYNKNTALSKAKLTFTVHSEAFHLCTTVHAVILSKITFSYYCNVQFLFQDVNNYCLLQTQDNCQLVQKIQ